MSGLLYFTTQEPGTDSRVVRINSDGTGQTVVTTAVVTAYPREAAVDTAAGFYFVLSNNSIDDHAYLLRGSLGSAAAPTIVVDFPDAIIVNSMQIDTINRKIYATYQDGSSTPNGNITGIRVYSYDQAGALTDLGFLTTAVSDNRADESGFKVLDARDFALDATIGRLFYTENIVGLTQGVFRLDLANPNSATQLVSQAQFPDNGSAGYIHDIEVDTTTDLVYFTTSSQYPSPDAAYNASQNGLWYINEDATGGTATKVTLTGLPGGHHIYPWDMTFDQGSRQIYIQSEDTFVGTSANNDVIYVFQLDAAGTSAALIRTITLSPQFTNDYGQFGGLSFARLASLGALDGATATILEQGAMPTALLASAPTITDDGGYLKSATVQITGGTFVSNESSFNDDTLGYGSGMVQSGTVPGTSITVSWNQATGTLTFTGYDTFAHYAAALANVHFQSSGNNPTNYGLSTTRTLTWTVDDGTLASPAGSESSGTTTVTIAGINDAPASASLSGDAASWTDGSGAVALDVGGNATIADADSANFNGGTLTVHIANVAASVDQLGLSAVGGVTFTATTVSVGGVQIATYTGGGAGGGDLVFTLDPDATPAAMQSLIRAVTYNNSVGAAAIGGTRNVVWTLVDGDGTANGGIDTLVVNSAVQVISANVAPAGTDHTASFNEDATYTFAAADFGYSDSDGNSFSGVRFTTLPGVGTIYLDTDGPAPGLPIAVGAGNIVALSEITVGHVYYVPAADGNGTSYASFTFQVRDNGGTAGGGVDLDQTPNTFTFDVTAVDDAPVQSGLPSTLFGAEDDPVALNGGIAIDPPPAWISDIDSASVTTTISAVDGSFAVTGSGTAVVSGNGTNSVTITGTPADVNLAVYQASYTPPADVAGSRTLTVSTSDGNGTDSDTIALTIFAVGDTPEGGDVTRSATEDTPYILSAADFGFSDVDGDSLADIQLGSVPLHGRIVDIGGYIIEEDITGDGIPDLFLAAPPRDLVAGDSLSLSLLAGGYIRYIPVADAHGAAADSFTYQVIDNGGTPGATIDPTPNTLTFDIAAVDDAAVANDDPTATVAENDLVNIAVLANDSDIDGPALAIATVNGVALTAGASTTLASGADVKLLADGTLTYDPAGHFDHLLSTATAALRGAFNTSATDSFTYTLTGGGTATVTVTVTGVDGAGDELWGDGGNNIITGTGSIDYFDLSQGGNDTASGLGGNDAFYFGAEFSGADTVDGGAGSNDQIGLEGDYTGANALVLGPGTITGIEVIALLAGFDYDVTTVDANVPSGGELRIFAGTLGLGDNLTFDGSAETNGTIKVYGGAGTDIITTGGGIDGIYFGPGRFDPLVDRVDGGTGSNDQLALDGDYIGLTLDGTAIKNIDVIALLKGVVGDLSDYDLTLDDTLIAAGETMTVWGSKLETALVVDGSGETDGNIRIFGGTLGDTLTGGLGNDWFWGGLGGDQMTGGAGADTFMYETAAQSNFPGFDTITGFDDAVDKIDLASAVTGFALSISGNFSTAGDLEAAASGLFAGQAVVFTATGGTHVGGTFLLIDANGTAGYQAANDYLIEMVGPTSPIDQVGMFI